MKAIHAFRSQKARKPHTCFWCGETIQPGTSYIVFAHQDPDDKEKVLTIRLFPECYTAWKDQDDAFWPVEGKMKRPSDNSDYVSFAESMSDQFGTNSNGLATLLGASVQRDE